MTYYKSDLYKDYSNTGDLSDVSEVDADELAAILGEVDKSADKKILGTDGSKEKRKEDKTKQEDNRPTTGPPNASGLRSDWLGLTDSNVGPGSKVSLSNRPATTSNLESFPSFSTDANVGGRSNKAGETLPSGRRENKQDLIKELFGDSKWASDKDKSTLGIKESPNRNEEKLKTNAVKSEEIAPGVSLSGKNPVNDESSYTPSTSAPRRPRRQPAKPLDLDDFGFAEFSTDKKEVKNQNAAQEASVPLKTGGDIKDQLSISGSNATTMKSSGYLGKPTAQNEPSHTINLHEKALTEESKMSHYSSLPQGIQGIESNGIVNPPQPTGILSGFNTQMQPVLPVNQLLMSQPVGPSQLNVVHPQFYPLPPPTVSSLPTGGGEMVEELKSAQATFGAALAAHHTNIHSYMQLLLDEARRLAAVTKVSDSKYNNKEASNERESLTTSPKPDIEGNYDDKKYDETHTQTDNEISQNITSQKYDTEDTKVKNDDSLQHHLIKELKMSIEKLEIENSSLNLKLHNLQTQHDMEIHFLKKTSMQDAMLWESRIEKIQQFCLTIENEYKLQVEKLKLNEEELTKNHRARIESLQQERLSDMQQLSDLHKAMMEQTLNSALIYTKERYPINLNYEKPRNEEELTEREASLLRRERQFEEKKLEWEEEKRKALGITAEKERAIREAEATWKAKHDSETRQLARREARTEELARLVEEMREQALTEAKALAADKLKVQTDRARLEALMKAETGILANPEHILQMRAEVEAGLEESREVKAILDGEKKRINEEWIRLESRVTEIESRERDINRIREELTREREDVIREREEYFKKKQQIDVIQERALAMEEEYKNKSRSLDEEMRNIEKEKLELKREKIEIETAKTRLDVLLPELGPNESFYINPPKNYIDPKAVIMRLKAEKDLEKYTIPTQPNTSYISKNNTFS